MESCLAYSVSSETSYTQTLCHIENFFLKKILIYAYAIHSQSDFDALHPFENPLLICNCKD